MTGYPTEDHGTHREAVFEAFSDPDRTFTDAIGSALDTGRDRLNLAVGVFSRVDDDTRIVESAVGDHPQFHAGATCPLDRAYCRRAIETDGLVAITDARAADAISAAAYETFELGTYIGCPIVVAGDSYGTVGFADSETRQGTYSEADKLFVELIARLTGRAIERRRHDQELQARNEKLRRERERFESIAETSFDILFQVSPEMELLYVSGAIERILGYPPGALEGESFETILDPESMPAAIEAFETVLAGEPVEFLELTYRTERGDTKILELNAQPMLTDGAVTAVHGVARDVTEIKERERDLRIRTGAMEEADVGITIADATEDGAPITYANAAFETLTGYTASEAGRIDFSFLHGPETDEKAALKLRTHAMSGRATTVELVAYRRDGGPFWNRIRVTPITDDGGSVTEYVAFHENVTERKRLEQLLERLNRVLRHNLRNDMNVLLGQSYRLKEGGEPSVAGDIDATIDELLAVAEKARDLEDVAQLDRAPARVDPRTICERAIDRPAQCYPAATISLDVDTDRDICVGEEFERALRELVENALKHVSEGDTDVEISVHDDGEFVEVTVADDGPGIPAMEAVVVDADEETPLFHGRGLGLWLVNWVVTRYGGSFKIGPRETGGTVAIVRLPAIEHGQTVESATRPPMTLFQ